MDKIGFFIFLTGGFVLVFITGFNVGKNFTTQETDQPDPRQQVTEIKMFCQNLAATTQRDDWKYASCLEELMQEYKVDAGIKVN